MVVPEIVAGRHAGQVLGGMFNNQMPNLRQVFLRPTKVSRACCPASDALLGKGGP
jgi:hypothetical protein